MSCSNSYAMGSLYQNHENIIIPKFDGFLSLSKFQNWLHQVDKVYEWYDLSDYALIELIKIFCRKHALEWWDDLTTKTRRDGKLNIRTWSKLRRELKEFLSCSYQRGCLCNSCVRETLDLCTQKLQKSISQLQAMKEDLHEIQQPIGDI